MSYRRHVELLGFRTYLWNGSLEHGNLFGRALAMHSIEQFGGSLCVDLKSGPWPAKDGDTTVAQGRCHEGTGWQLGSGGKNLVGSIRKVLQIRRKIDLGVQLGKESGTDVHVGL
jgi:hypothetical protein